MADVLGSVQAMWAAPSRIPIEIPTCGEQCSMATDRPTYKMSGTSDGYAVDRTSAASMPLFWDQEVSGSIPPAPSNPRARLEGCDGRNRTGLLLSRSPCSTLSALSERGNGYDVLMFRHTRVVQRSTSYHA